MAVEVDGPSHFWGRTPTGATALKRRQLRAARVGVAAGALLWEWDALGSSKAAKEEYLRAAILGLSEARHTSELISEEGRAVQAHGHSVHGLKGSACVCVSV